MQELDPRRHFAHAMRPTRSRVDPLHAPAIGPRAGPQDHEHEFRRVLEELSETLQASAAILYTPELDACGWELTRCVWVGSRADQYSRELRRVLRNRGPNIADFFDYDPLAVEPEQRNRVLTRSRLHFQADPLFGPLAPAHCDQLRVLICHGPRLLAWVGLLRERPFERHEADVLQAQIESLRRLLLREWSIESACLNRSLLEGVLEALGGPAFVLSEHGRVEYANSAGLAFLDGESGARALDGLRSAIAHGGEHPGFDAIALDAHGCPGHLLLLRVPAAVGSAAEQAIAIKRELWGLDARQAMVLERVAQGQSNKEIAAAMGCAEVTVERVLTRLLRASGSRSRCELIARLHQR
jgi:DNA-binding CsgD family transcriptional regulator